MKKYDAVFVVVIVNIIFFILINVPIAYPF